MVSPEECDLEPAGFVPLSPEEEVIGALCDGNAPKAAAVLRQIESAGRLLLDSLASMLDDNRSRNRDCPAKFTVRLVFTAWGRGRPARSDRSPAGSPDEEIVAALIGQNASATAKLFRQVDSVGKPVLRALADMLDGDAASRPELKQLYPRRLKIVTAASVGRPKRGEKRSLTAKPERLRKSDKKTKAWEVVMARRVKRARDSGASRKEAIDEARMSRPFDDKSGRKRTPPSYEAVEKAYDSIYGNDHRRVPTRGLSSKAKK